MITQLNRNKIVDRSDSPGEEVRVGGAGSENVISPARGLFIGVVKQRRVWT